MNLLMNNNLMPFRATLCHFAYCKENICVFTYSQQEGDDVYEKVKKIIQKKKKDERKTKIED